MDFLKANVQDLYTLHIEPCKKSRALLYEIILKYIVDDVAFQFSI